MVEMAQAQSTRVCYDTFSRTKPRLNSDLGVNKKRWLGSGLKMVSRYEYQLCLAGVVLSDKLTSVVIYILQACLDASWDLCICRGKWQNELTIINNIWVNIFLSMISSMMHLLTNWRTFDLILTITGVNSLPSQLFCNVLLVWNAIMAAY